MTTRVGSTHYEVYGNGEKLRPTASPIRKFLHNNPTVLKTAFLGLGVLGLKTFTEGIKNYSFSTVFLGAAIAVSSCILHKISPLFVPPTHNPANKVFKEESCKGVSIHYEGNLPILTIPKEISSYDAGYARGYLMASQIKDLLEKNDFVFHTILGLPHNIPYLIEKMKKVIPPEYKREMEGLVKGYSDKKNTWPFFKGRDLTFEEVIYFHLLPDKGHLDFDSANWWSFESEVMGCSVVIDGDDKTGPRMIRTVDWYPLDVNGKYAFIEMRETNNGIKTVGQSFPLFVGCLTAMNHHGLCVAMNVAKGITDYTVKMPAVFYLRQLLENCDSVKRGENSAEAFWKNHSPLGPFNMSILDENDAAGVHFYQAKDKSHFVRWWEPDRHLATLNFRYGEEGETNPTVTNSPQRKEEIKEYYRKSREEDSSVRLKGVLNGNEVNNIRTSSAAYLDPRTRRFETAFDNGYAADRPLMNIPTHTWFGIR